MFDRLQKLSHWVLNLSISAGLTLLVLSLPQCQAEVAMVRPSADDSHVLDGYRGKTLMLREPYCGGHLKFGVDGQLLNGGHSGSWTLCRDIQVEDIKLKGQTLSIKGRRAYLFFDSVQKKFREIKEALEEHAARYRDVINDQKVSIELPVQTALDDASLQAALGKIFWPGPTDPGETVPAVWKSYFSGKSLPAKEEPGGLRKSGGVYRVGNGVKPPKVTYAPDPDYSDVARTIGFKGVVVLSVVVDAEGRVSNVTIARPLGLGLDENAIAKILTWRFVPATRDGGPVAVEVSVEVSFNLY